jgi:membrane-associated phospholipid phosphatase
MPERRRWIVLLTAAVTAVAVAHALDPLAFRYLRFENVYDEDWGRMLRVMGFVPLWLTAAAALALHQRTPLRRLPRAPAGLLALAATLSGAAAELLKLVFRRLRPGDLGEYLFRPLAERPFYSGGLGLPSSHALVAFGAAALLSRLYPRSWIVWWALAWGCALTRVAAGAHFLSDVVVAAMFGWGMGALVWRWRRPSGSTNHLHTGAPA